MNKKITLFCLPIALIIPTIVAVSCQKSSNLKTKNDLLKTKIIEGINCPCHTKYNVLSNNNQNMSSTMLAAIYDSFNFESKIPLNQENKKFLFKIIDRLNDKYKKDDQKSNIFSDELFLKYFKISLPDSKYLLNHTLKLELGYGDTNLKSDTIFIKYSIICKLRSNQFLQVIEDERYVYIQGE